ncbi:TonB-dependent receptor [Acinetobacter populi]|uniref:TonB-dependent receptor n=1 Tax=Acinetobacter populi TaxID=1582270 RepID=UPI003B59F8F3
MTYQSPLAIAIKISLFSLAATLSPAIFAEDNVQQLPTIEVEADKDFANGKIASQSNLGSLGEKSVIDTPFSVTTYTSQLIQDQQASTVAAVLKNDPGIRTITNSGHLNENFTIRGFSSSWEDYNLNGLYGVAPTGRIPTDILGSITLLKGPNALIAGTPPTGTVGGVIMAHTKRADQDLTQVSASYEDGGYYKSGFDISRRFGENKEFGARASASYGQGEHIIENMDDTNTAGVIALDWTTDKFKINFDAYSVRDKRDGGSPAMVSFATLGKVLQAPSGDSNYFPNLKGQQQSEYVGLTGEYKFTPDFKVFAGIAYAEREYVGHLFGTRMIVRDFTAAQASNLGYGNSALSGTDGYALTQYYRVGSKEHNTVANTGFEGKFNTGNISHIVGLRADYLTRDFWQHYGPTQSQYITNLYNPEVGYYGEMPTTYPVVGPYGDNKYVSYTLTDQLSLFEDKLQFILGARYQDMDIKNEYAKTKYSSDKLSPSVGITIKPFGNDLSFYTSYVEGLTQGSTIDNVKDANDGKTFAPFQTKQYEFGAKYQAGSWLNTLAFYQIEKPSTLTTAYTDSSNENITQITTDGAKTRSRGVEWSFSGHLTQDLSVLGNLAYIDAEYVKSALTTGKTVEGTPDFTAALLLDYKIPTLEDLSVNARATYISKQYLDSTNVLELSDYTIVDLGAKYATKVGGVNTTFRANVDNVADKKYWAGVFTSGYATVGEGRTYKLGVTFDF